MGGHENPDLLSSFSGSSELRGGLNSQNATASSLAWSTEKSRTTCHAVAKEQPARLATSVTGACGARSSGRFGSYVHYQTQ